MRRVRGEKIKLNQVWKQKGHDHYVLIAGKKGRRWLAKVMGHKPNVFKGSHRLSDNTLHSSYELQ